MKYGRLGDESSPARRVHPTASHNTRVHGRETGHWHEADPAVAHRLQHTSRDGDLQLPVHSQVARTVTDGKWQARWTRLAIA